jgi:hypothetical protein
MVMIAATSANSMLTMLEDLLMRALLHEA